MPKPTYKLVQSKRTRKWYVFGACGNGKYMQTSDGYRSREEAAQRMRLNVGAEQASKDALSSWDGDNGYN